MPIPAKKNGAFKLNAAITMGWISALVFDQTFGPTFAVF